MAPNLSSAAALISAIPDFANDCPGNIDPCDLEHISAELNRGFPILGD
jgi:hypothetical protein